jgi:adenine phosphoribosyltransferase
MPPDTESAPAARSDEQLRELLLSHIRDVPDFPEPGIVFKDITPLLADAVAFAALIDAFVAYAGDVGPVDKVVGIEARGFILGAPVAHALGVGFVPVRKKGKLPGATHQGSYALEYGTASIEVVTDAFTPSERVLIVDDVLATGGTVVATLELVRRAGAEVAGIALLMELDFLGGRSRLTATGDDVHVLLTV